MFQQCFDEAEKHYDETVGREKKLTRDDWAHGSLLIVNELLRCSNVEGEVTIGLKNVKKMEKMGPHPLGLGEIDGLHGTSTHSCALT